MASRNPWHRALCAPHWYETGRPWLVGIGRSAGMAKRTWLKLWPQLYVKRSESMPKEATARPTRKATAAQADPRMSRALYAPRPISAAPVKKHAAPNWNPVDRPIRCKVRGGSGGPHAWRWRRVECALKQRAKSLAWCNDRHADEAEDRQHAKDGKREEHDKAVLERLGRRIGHGQRQR
eukprot:scaffold222302_cov35-Tisochrysis_lutea.AAC.2